MDGPAVDERRHHPGRERNWEESWSFDFVSGDGAVGGFVRLALHPARRRAWYWAYLARPGRPVVVVRDHDVEAPRGRELEVRGDGLWAQVICETPFEHWSAGLEAFAVAIDDPARAWGDERGDPTALGLDLEWEMQAPARSLPVTGYVQPADVHGEVLVGAERLALDGTGSYTHTWGPPGWLEPGWWALTARFDDHTAVAARSPGWASTWLPGDCSQAAGPSGTTASLDTRWRGDGLPESAELVLDRVATLPVGPSVGIAPLALVPVPLDAAGRRHGVLVRALCSFTTATGTGTGRGRAGRGWSEWLRPPDGPTP
ncbi:MAG: hypothetical protein ACR2LJ_00820 [Acidimicrobiales bacterium]